MDWFRYWPSPYCCNLFWISRDTFAWDYMSKEFDLFLKEWAFVWTYLQVVLIYFCNHLFKTLKMLIQCFCENYYIIQIKQENCQFIHNCNTNYLQMISTNNDITDPYTQYGNEDIEGYWYIFLNYDHDHFNISIYNRQIAETSEINVPNT